MSLCDASPKGLHPLETFGWLILRQRKSCSPLLSRYHRFGYRALPRYAAILLQVPQHDSPTCFPNDTLFSVCKWKLNNCKTSYWVTVERNWGRKHVRTALHCCRRGRASFHNNLTKKERYKKKTHTTTANILMKFGCKKVSLWIYLIYINCNNSLNGLFLSITYWICLDYSFISQK